MKRIVLTDGSGNWFDAERSLSWDEAMCWDGRNHISKATGSQWEHERLHYTASGRWVLEFWSQMDGVGPAYTEITVEVAAQWLLKNEIIMHGDELDPEPPADVKEQLLEAVKSLEV